ncbi:Helix-turn-helix domain [Frankia torreyi]|uniref:Helix-turn-helix domain n=1 Tax=Frankia torreyi TaxID=1856 RepID=A0A0D8B7V2_9ACTN|nr:MULTISPECIES: helix-turn-helix domain-containing protein [Frankia]KJE20353.1 Helix-turn-helix domain [Frankia torreyi]KQM02743.1 Helix-turn-helix domain [Frankia sp. CpI1-P]
MNTEQAQSTEADSLLTPGEFADALRVDVATVARWARNGDVDSIELPGGSRRYRRSTLAAILAGRSTTPDAA